MTPEAELTPLEQSPALPGAMPVAQVRRWIATGQTLPSEPCFVFDGPDLTGDLSQVSVLLTTAGEVRADALLDAGAAQVMLADAALFDSEIVRRLAMRHGPERIGVWVTARRMTVSWSLDRVSNADFKCLTPSLPQPAWEVLTSAGIPTGTLADWWISQMRALGASSVLVSLTHAEDADLAICAGLVEDCGEALWLAPPSECAVPPGDWSEFGQARQLVWPANPHALTTEAVVS